MLTQQTTRRPHRDKDISPAIDAERDEQIRLELDHYAYLATRRETRDVDADRKRQRIANHPKPDRRREQWRAAQRKVRMT